MPALLLEYGLRPWEYELLTLDELAAITEHQDARYREAQQRR